LVSGVFGNTTTAGAQTKAENKLYNSVLSKGDLKTANKFLAKFPESVYAVKVTRLRDSIIFNTLDSKDVTAYTTFLEQYPKSYFATAAGEKIAQLNTSSIDDSQAMQIAKELCGDSILGAKGLKSLNKEHIVAISAPVGTSYTITVLQQTEDNWNKLSEHKEEIYTNDSALSDFTLTPNIQSVTVNGEQHLFYAYTNTTTGVNKRSNLQNLNAEYVANLYSLKDNSVYNALYSGKSLQMPVIYGNSMDSAAGGAMATPQMTWLLRHFGKNENLKPYNKELFRTQESIEWWYESNPQGAGNIQFGIIPDNSEMAERFKSSKGRERVGNYEVAMFDIANNTVVVVYNREESKYSLALCQKIPANKEELELGSFYGEKGNTLVLYFYKGNNSIKKRLNLASKRYY
ncbi:MAG: hypothetical protein Q4B21_07815, partial [Bacteroidia bacterium]|nr:hypothetical protein [Bacteroidia bacterium]